MRPPFPYRVTIWRRVLQRRPGVASWLVLATPALVGSTLLAVALPAIGDLLSTESRLTGSAHAFQLHTDCDSLFVTLDVQPYEFYDYESWGKGQSDTTTSHIVVHLRRGVGRTCRVQAGSTIMPRDEGPTLVEYEGGLVTADRGAAVDFGTATDVRLKLRWPGLFEYAHRDHGWVGRLLGASSAASSFMLEWNPDWQDVRPDSGASTFVDAVVVINAPNDFAPRDILDFFDIERTDLDVTFYNRRHGEVVPTNRVFAEVRFRTQDFEAKMNFALLLGGAIIGLGITLVVESLIAGLFRFEEVVTARWRRGASQEAPPERRATPEPRSDSAS